MSVRSTSTTKECEAIINARTQLMIRLMVEDVHRKSNYITPYRKGGLRGAVNKRMQGKKGIIEWTVPYAAYQERGMARDGSRVVKHYTTPGTHAHFAEESVQAVMDNPYPYAKNAGLTS